MKPILNFLFKSLNYHVNVLLEKLSSTPFIPFRTVPMFSKFYISVNSCSSGLKIPQEAYLPRGFQTQKIQETGYAHIKKYIVDYEFGFEQ